LLLDVLDCLVLVTWCFVPAAMVDCQAKIMPVTFAYKLYVLHPHLSDVVLFATCRGA
jgi:hypothetical protein